MPRLGPFELSRPLDEGGLARVWAAVHVPTRLPVAIKVLDPGLEDEVQRRAVRDELRAMARLHHPHIVAVLDRGVVGVDAYPLPSGVPWMALEFAPGGSLLERDRPQPWPVIRTWLLELLAALGHAHAHGVLHRDVKPSNVLLDARQRTKLCDFGLATALEPDEASQHGGTPRYMAPEQFLDAAAMQGPWTDLYSLGCLAWRLVTGAPPYTDRGREALERAHCHAAIPELVPWTAVPEDLALWLHHLLAKDPRARFTTAPDAAWHLLDLGPPTVQPPEHEDLGDFLEAATISREPAPLPVRAHPLGEALPLPLTPSAPPFPPLGTPRRPTPPRLTAASLPLFHLRPMPLAGRRGAQRALWRLLGEVHEQRAPRLAVLTGPAGTGAAELATWLVEQARETGAGGAMRAVHNPVAGPYDGLLGMLRRHFRWRRGQRERVATALARRGETDPAKIEALWQWLDGGRPTASACQHMLVEHLRRLVVQRPYVLVVEDAQWAADALAACRALQATDLPLLVVITADARALADRPVERRLLAALEPLSIALEPLAGQDAAAFAAALPLPDRDAALAVVERAGGLPLFAMQILAEWVAEGRLHAGPAGPVLAEGALESVPADLGAVWRRRVERLLATRPAADRRALYVAAALGRVVPREEWRAACGLARTRADSALVEALIDAGLARRSRGEEPAWSFARASLREAILAGMGEEGAEVHRACAEWLDRSGGAPARRAWHLLEAGDGPLAVPSLLAGASEALSRGEYATGAELLALAEPLLAEPADRLEHRATAAALAHRRGERARAADLALELLELAEAEGIVRYRVRARSLLLITALASGDQTEALSWAEEAAELAEASGEDALVASTALGLGDILLRLGRVEAAKGPLTRAASLGSSPNSALLAWLRLAEVDKSLGHFEAALGRVRAARELAEAMESASARASCDLAEAEVLRYAGRHAESERAYARATQRMEALGEVGTHAARIGWGLALLLTGALDAGLAQIDAGLDHATRHGFPGSEAYGLCARAVWAAHQPEPMLFKAQLLAALERIAELDYVEPDFPEVLEAGARRLLALGMPSRAQRLRDAAGELWSRLDLGERAEAARALIAPPRRGH